MSKEERALPKPGKTPFSRKRREEEGQDDLLIADQMAMAAAEGKLDEYLEQELPEGEYAKKLARMMMGMTGILPPDEGPAMTRDDLVPSSRAVETEKTGEGNAAPAVPEDVVEAAKAGDAGKLKELLAREQGRRTPDQGGATGEERVSDKSQHSPSMIEKEMLDTLIKIAADNSVSVDWLMARALKLYLKEYQKTGRL